MSSRRVASPFTGRLLRGRSPARLVLVLGWVVPAAVAVLGFRVVPSRLNPGLSFGGIVAMQLAMWLPWGLWSLLVARVAERWPLERGRVARAVLVHIPLCAVVVTAQILIVNAVSVAFGVTERRGLDSVLAIGLRQYGDLFTVVYWAVVGVDAAFRWHEAWRGEALRAARLSADLAHSQLAALRAQLHPHFLFNALNAVVALVGEDPAAARRVTVRLAELLRATLAATERATLPMREELDLTRRYLEIEQVRFGDRLRVIWEVTPETEDVMVPAFLLQPLVENALVHAVAPRATGGTLTIRAWLAGGALHLSVLDDGPGPQRHAATRGSGVGLSNLRERLERLYPALAALELTRAPGGGADARVILPADLVPPSPPPPPDPLTLVATKLAEPGPLSARNG